MFGQDAVLGVSPPSGGHKLATAGAGEVGKRQSFFMEDQATKQPHEWLVLSLVLKLRTGMIARLETRSKSRTNELPPKVSSGFFLLACFLLWHCPKFLGPSLLPFCGPLGWRLHTLFLHQRTWFSRGLMKCFVAQQGKGVGPSLIWLPVTAKNWI